MEGYGEALAYEVAPFGVQVTLVEPGNVRTDFTSSRRDVPVPEGPDPYGATRVRAIGKMEDDERHGVPSDAVATVVAKVLESARPPRRVSVGRLGERVGIVGKRLLPYRLFEAGAKGSLGV
jgi:NAD(P)-dependent dehydrogenase (short-subunit alcohol dehydrogenase family)